MAKATATGAKWDGTKAGFVELPDGAYKIQGTSVEKKTWSNGEDGWTVKVEVLEEGDYQSKVVSIPLSDALNKEAKNGQFVNLEKMQAALAAFGLEPEEGEEFDTDELVPQFEGREAHMIARMDNRTNPKTNKPYGVKYDFISEEQYNDIKGISNEEEDEEPEEKPGKKTQGKSVVERFLKGKKK